MAITSNDKFFWEIIMTIVWRKQMSVGNSIIDDQHRYLICLMNTIEITLSSDEHRDIFKTAIDQLVEYTRYHFEQEERIQYKMKYPYAYEHKIEHQEIMAEMLNIKTKINAFLDAKSDRSDQPDAEKEIADDELDALLEDDTDEPQLDLVDLTSLMRRWVLDHVLKADLKMKPYLTDLSPTFS
jgi:hemerythrin